MFLMYFFTLITILAVQITWKKTPSHAKKHAVFLGFCRPWQLWFICFLLVPSKYILNINYSTLWSVRYNLQLYRCLFAYLPYEWYILSLYHVHCNSLYKKQEFTYTVIRTQGLSCVDNSRDRTGIISQINWQI